MSLSPVSTFGDEQLGRWHGGRIAQDRQASPAQIARECDSMLATAGLDFQCHHGRAEQMAGIHKADLHSRSDLARPIIGDRLTLAGAATGVLPSVKRLD